MSLSGIVYRWMYLLPYFGKKLKLLDSSKYPPGHYYSTIPDLDEVRKNKDRIFDTTIRDLPGIDLNDHGQYALLESFAKYFGEMPFAFMGNGETETRYSSNDAWYRYSDVVMLYSMMRQFRPSRIIEIGSGYSSAVMLDTRERFFNDKTELVFIDPYIERLLSIMKPGDRERCTIIQNNIQDVPVDIFDSLAENDILFIDSSHVSKAGSDLNHILFNILPRLRPGVLIHFHDIYYPFEMPEHWVLERHWFWNENYLVRAYLTGNRDYKIINFNSYLHRKYRDWFAVHMPVCLENTEDTGSIWLQKSVK